MKKISLPIKCAVCAVLALACLLIIPDRVSFAAETAEQRGYFTFLYDNSNGLPTSEANAVVQTSIGFVWIGGYSGLTRYDGANFKHFDATEGITSVNCMFVDSKDRLWIGTNDKGLAVRQNAKFQFWSIDEGLTALSVRAICEDRAGNIIIATTEGMAYVDTENQLHMIDDPQISGKYVRRLNADPDGVIYGCTMDSRLFVMENLEFTAFYTAEDIGVAEVVCVTPDPKEKGRVYIGTECSNIVSVNLKNVAAGTKKFSVSPQERVTDILIASDGKIWIGASDGMGYFDENMRYTELKNSEITSAVVMMSEDMEGNIWCASSRQGVMKVVASPFVDITGISGLPREVVNTTCIYQNDLYIGTDTGLRLLDSNYNIKTNVLTTLLEGVRIRSIKEGSKGNLWICTYGTDTDYGLVCYHGDGTYDIFNEKAGMVSDKVRTLTELSDGTIAVACTGGINLIKDGKITATYDESSGIKSPDILSIIEGDDGSIYFGTDGSGLYILKNGVLKSMGINDGLKSQVIMQLHKDVQRGVYWIITGNSIAYMKNEEIHTLANFPYSNNIDMQFDANGGIWILSSNGIYFVNGDDMIMDSSNMLYSFYDIRSGLPSIATANSRSYISPDGTLYIAGGSGVSSININTARHGKNDAKLVVPFVEIDGEEIYVKQGETIVVPSDCKRFTLYAYAMTYAHNPQVSYYIEGFDDKPIVVSRHEMQPLTFTRPHSGKYVFHMSIVDVMTGVNTNSIAVNIEVEKQLIEQWWFWVSIAAGVALITIFIIRAYVRHNVEKLKQKEKQDRLFIREIIQVFAKTIDIKDQYTNGHSFRVAEYTKMIAEKAGYDESEAEKVYNIGLMHDIGKITVPNEILNKPGRLTDEEFEIMKFHASNGYEILKEVEIDPNLALGAGYHHERIDGRGYPSGKKGDEIPEIAKMIAVADTFDAMYSSRPYRTKMPIEKVIAELKRVSGTQLSEKYVNIMLKLIEEGKAFDD